MEHLKSSKYITKLKNLYKTYGRVINVLVYLLILSTASYLIYLRFTLNFTSPNFYAEDGSIFINNLVNKGTLGSLVTTFNGYFVWGIYMLGKISLVIDRVFFSGQFVDIPKSIALTSYVFLGFIATLPIVLFKNLLKPYALFIIVILSIFVPLTGMDYAIIGTIGNTKFAFTYLAFLLLAYRHIVDEKTKGYIFTDIGLLICAYTSVTVYLMIPFALFRYLPKFNFKNTKRSVSDLFKKRSFKSLCLLILLLLPQVIIVLINGTPDLPGYLDSPFNFNRAIEILVSRSYLYSVLFPLNKHLNDVLAVVILLVVFVVGLRIHGKTKQIFWFGIYSIAVSSVLLVSNRTGISDLYYGYKSSGPDQFFYAQNLIFIFILVSALYQFINKLKWKQRYLVNLVIIITIVYYLIPQSGTFGDNNVQFKENDNIYASAKKICHSSQNDYLPIVIYPDRSRKYENIPRSKLCTEKTENYKPDTVYLGLSPFENNYVDHLNSNQLFQTFVSPNNNLNGLEIYFSTFNNKIRSQYYLYLYEEDCSSEIYKVKIPSGRIKDNSLTKTSFTALNNSLGKSYCFSVMPDAENTSPLAVQLSKPNIYTDGKAILNGKTLDNDVVFNLNYKTD